MNQKSFIFYSIIWFIFLFILLSNPFLRYPYDMIHHLMVIDDLYTQILHPVQKMVGVWANDIYIMVPTGDVEPIDLERKRYLWHFIWAKLFYLFDIDSTQMFLRAKIIHIIQTIISLGAVYYFSKVVLRNVFKEIALSQLRWLSAWSVFIWFTIFATKSADYHQVWMMWYSVNYQITLPLFWYMLALTLVIVLEETSVWKKLFFVVQIMMLSRIILQIHSMEFLYYLMYMTVFSMLYIDKIYLFLKKYFYLFIPIVFGIGYFMKHYQPEHSKIVHYLSWDKLPQLYEKIMQEGALLLSGYNRASASMNELIYFVGISGSILILYVGLRYTKAKQKNTNFNIRMLIFIGITSLFVLIPLYQFSSGLFGMLTKTMVVNRLYYSSSLFILLPIVVYGLFSKYRLHYINVIMALLLVGVALFSKYSDSLNHNYYKNIQSIKNSFYTRKVGFNLTSTQIETIGKMIQQYEQNNTTAKTIKFYARADIAFVIKYIYHKNVYWEDRRANPVYKKIYEKHKQNKAYYRVLFKIPKDFPAYDPFT